MKMLEKVFGTQAKLKTLLYLQSLPPKKKIQIKQLAKNTGLSYFTLKKVLEDFRKAKIIVIMGATKGRYVMIANTKQRRIIWKFLRDFKGSYLM